MNKNGAIRSKQAHSEGLLLPEMQNIYTSDGSTPIFIWNFYL